VPGVLYYHGGGFIVGGLESYDPVCRSLCNASGCRLIAVDYRLAPEHKFPAALADAEAAWDWVASHRQEIGVTERIGVAGDSSGGNLAAVLAQCRRSRGPELAFQLLAYPMVTMRDRPASERVPLIGPLVYLATIALVRKRYVPADADLSDPRLAPENVDDLCGLPPAYVITAGIDPLHDGIVAYVQRLKAAGNSVTHMDYPSMPHGFLNALGIFEQARQAIADAGAAMKNALFVL
jgi:acetyl esterase